jgi:hypothetical protein
MIGGGSVEPRGVVYPRSAVSDQLICTCTHLPAGAGGRIVCHFSLKKVAMIGGGSVKLHMHPFPGAAGGGIVCYFSLKKVDMIGGGMPLLQLNKHLKRFLDCYLLLISGGEHHPCTWKNKPY